MALRMALRASLSTVSRCPALMATTDSMVTVTISGWRMSLLRAHVCLMNAAVRLGMPVERATKLVGSAVQWAVRGAKVR